VKRLATAVMALIALLALGHDASAQQFRKPMGHVNDYAAKLTVLEANVLEQKLADYKARTRHEIAVTIVQTLNNLTIEEYANKMFEEWGIGSKEKDDGVLLLIAVTERKVRIEPGYGAEGAITDGTAGNIVRKLIVPPLRQDKWSEGVNAGVDAIIARLDGDRSLDPGQAVEAEKPIPVWVIVLIVAIIIIVLAVLVIAGAGSGDGGGGYSSRGRSRSSSWSSSGSSGSSSRSSGGFGGFGGGRSGGGGATGSF
jgi:uncharacterized protein